MNTLLREYSRIALATSFGIALLSVMAFVLVPTFFKKVNLELNYEGECIAKLQYRTKFGLINTIVRGKSYALTPGHNLVQLPLNTNVLNISLCNNQNLLLNSIEIQNNQNTYRIPQQTIAHWDCFDCQSILEGDEITLISHGSSALETKSFDSHIGASAVRWYRLLTKFYRYGWLVFIPFLISLALTMKKFIFEMFAGTAILSYLVIDNWYEIRSRFPIARVESLDVIGYTHYFGHSIIADQIIFLTVLLIPLLVYGLLSLRDRFVHHFRKKDSTLMVISGLLIAGIITFFIFYY